MDKKIMALSILFLAVFGLQFAGPVAAVKVVDHGTKYGYDPIQSCNMKITWNTYQYNHNFLKFKVNVYNKKHGKYVFEASQTYYVAKVAKNTVKVTYSQKYNLIKYYKTKLTAAQHYWRVDRALMTSTDFYV